MLKEKEKETLKKIVNKYVDEKIEDFVFVKFKGTNGAFINYGTNNNVFGSINISEDEYLIAEALEYTSKELGLY